MQTTINIEKIHRFELFPNSSNIGSEQSFNLYGILIIPQLLGSIMLHYIFDIRQMHFWIVWIVLAMILWNIYFFYKKIIYHENIIKLIINNNYLHIIDNKNTYMQTHIENVIVKKNISGKKRFPTIEIRSEDFKGISIGLKREQTNLDEGEIKTLSLPDYWLINEKEWDNLSQQLFKNATPFI